MNAITVKYGDFAVGAKEDFKAKATNAESFVDVAQLERSGIFFPNYGNPCELYSVPLDGKTLPFPSEPTGKALGYWSDIVSDENAEFDGDITITLTAQNLYTSTGLTLVFDEYNEIHPAEIFVIWYADGEIVTSDVFEVTSGAFFCENRVIGFDRVDIIVHKMNMPFSRLKLRSIEYGKVEEFTGVNLKAVSISQEIDPISTEIAINTADLTINTSKEQFFQKRQQLFIYNGDNLVSVGFVKTAERTSKTAYNVSAEDFIGLLENIPYRGYFCDEEAASLVIKNIFEQAKVPYELDTEYNGAVLSGYIPYTTCRDALMQVAFALQAAVDTSNSDRVQIYPLSNDITQVIPRERIMEGQTFTNEDVVTRVELTGHTYTYTAEDVTAYDAAESGTGENITVIFDDPLHTLSITNGTIVTRTAAMAVINAQSGCVLRGKKIAHSTFIKGMDNPDTLADVPNVATITGATLVSRSNIDNVLLSCYNQLTRSKKCNARIVEGIHGRAGNYTYDKPVKLGDVVALASPFMENVTARAVKQTFSLYGGVIVKDTELR